MAKTVFFYNGATGGLGKYMGDALHELGEIGHRLQSRLEDPVGLRKEIRSHVHVHGGKLVFLQLASLVSVPLCEKEPERARKTNVEDVCASASAFVEAAKEFGATAEIVYVSSGHLYAPKASGKISETDPVGPRSVYARTKLEAEQALSKFTTQTGTRLTIARVFGLVAPSQPANYVLPGLVRRAKEKNLTGVPGLDNERDYLDARDVCRALVKLGTRPATGTEIVNVCSGEAVTIRHLLELALIDTVGKDGAKSLSSTITAGPSRPDDIISIVGDPSRYVSLLGENPKRIPIERTVQEAVAFASQGIL